MVSKVTNFDAQSWNPNKNNVKLKKKKYFPFSLGVNPQGKFEESRRGGGGGKQPKTTFPPLAVKIRLLTSGSNFPIRDPNQQPILLISGIQTSTLTC